MRAGPGFSLDCQCGGQYRLDSFAIDTFTCQNKHVFFFKCPDCGAFSATAMANIAQSRWTEFVPAEQLAALQEQYRRATRRSG